MRHAREVRHHGCAADVLAERQRQRRVHVVVCLGRRISPSVTISRFSFGDFQAQTYLPGMTSTTRTLITESARARSFARVVIWLAFTPGAGPQLEARDHRARLHGHHFDFDAEILELHFDQARQRLQRLRGIRRLRAGGSSSSVSGGSSLAFTGSNSGTCRSFSTRSLFSTTGVG